MKLNAPYGLLAEFNGTHAILTTHQTIALVAIIGVVFFIAVASVFYNNKKKKS